METARQMPFSFAPFGYGTNKNKPQCTNLIIGVLSLGFICYSIDSSRIFRIPAFLIRAARRSETPSRLQCKLRQ
jgi:hypothetical protein